MSKTLRCGCVKVFVKGDPVWRGYWMMPFKCEDNDVFFRCSCGAQMSTSTGVDNHRAGALRAEVDRLAQEKEQLRAWVDQQIEGIQRSSLNEASRGAVAAFVRVKDRLDG